MDSSVLRHVYLLGLAALLAFLPAQAATTPAPEADTLKVQVIVPPAWHPLIDDQMSEALVDRVRDVFYRSGFTQRIDEMRAVEDPAKAPC
ncbi:MAG: hypothetical protein NTV51_29375, partial [Verrucomicrobia bacterium]|nr:hypothetical protein [Verrucomicrobiota bacterium]